MSHGFSGPLDHCFHGVLVSRSHRAIGLATMVVSGDGTTWHWAVASILPTG